MADENDNAVEANSALLETINSLITQGMSDDEIIDTLSLYYAKTGLNAEKSHKASQKMLAYVKVRAIKG